MRVTALFKQVQELDDVNTKDAKKAGDDDSASSEDDYIKSLLN